MLLRSASQCIAASMKLDHLHTQRMGCSNLRRIRIDEQADLNSRSVQVIDSAPDTLWVTGDVQAASVVTSSRRSGNQRGLMRLHVAGNAYDFSIASQLQVQPRDYGLLENVKIAVLDVAAGLRASAP